MRCNMAITRGIKNDPDSRPIICTSRHNILDGSHDWSNKLSAPVVGHFLSWQHLHENSPVGMNDANWPAFCFSMCEVIECFGECAE